MPLQAESILEKVVEPAQPRQTQHCWPDTRQVVRQVSDCMSLKSWFVHPQAQNSQANVMHPALTRACRVTQSALRVGCLRENRRECPPSTGRGRRTRLCGCRPVPCAARQYDHADTACCHPLHSPPFLSQHSAHRLCDAQHGVLSALTQR